jgi:hypothetical protein
MVAAIADTISLNCCDFFKLINCMYRFLKN